MEEKGKLGVKWYIAVFVCAQLPACAGEAFVFSLGFAVTFAPPLVGDIIYF